MAVSEPLFFSTRDIFHDQNSPVDVFRVTHVESMPLHRHEFAEIVVVTSGEAVHNFDGSESLLMMGDVFVVHPGSSHGYSGVRTLGLTNILFYPELLAIPRDVAAKNGESQSQFLVPPAPGDTQRLHLRLTPDQLVETNTMVRETEQALISGGPGSSLTVVAAFLKIVGSLVEWQSEVQKTNPGFDHQLSKAFTFVAESYSDKITLADLTRAAGMSESSLTRGFKKAAGLSPIEYVIAYRVRQSCRLLEYTDESVTEIAFDTGFSDSNYFTRKFHDLMGVTPVQYRKNSRVQREPLSSAQVLPKR